MKIYTKTGDAGETSLFDNSRVSKADARVDAYGEVDELNACLGAARAAGVDPDIGAVLEPIQRDLFAARRAAGRSVVAHRGARDQGRGQRRRRSQRLEQTIDRLESELPPLRRFILPGGSPAGALLHLARTVCRRAERRVVGARRRRRRADLVVYLNRLSDLLFVMARAVNHRAGAPETEW